MSIEGETRKVVTLVFCDIANSTQLGGQLDPESLRRMMSRYFTEMKEVLERHGGVVEKFIGDAVAAVFGVPRAHEDDALRAVRAAVEMREAQRQLNEELEAELGVGVSIRIGVNTGEVVAGDPSRGELIATGDAVNVAARLEQSAQPDEIQIGEATYRLVREAIVAEKIGPVTVKGKPAPLTVWKLLDVVPGAPGLTRRLDSPLVGRERELAELREIFERTVRTGAAELGTLMGSAGVGKSRLTNEFLAETRRRATVVTGRCVSYGEGNTFAPLVSVLREAMGIGERDSLEEARRRLVHLIPDAADGALIRERLAPLLGLAPAPRGIQETFWAVRRLFERLAATQALVIVFDDIHWGEETFLDLLEYLADWIRSASVLILCAARPELHELRPGWMTGKTNATLLTLEPLTEPEIEGLITNLIGRAELAPEARERIAELSEGNPLFVEETLRMLVDDGVLSREDGGWSVTGDLSGTTIPPTIHTLLTARLDRLEPEERSLIERASVAGRTFSWGALAALSAPEVTPRLSRHLQSLVRKELIRPDHSTSGPDDTFRFAHVLVRDAAYRGIPKGVRAELHERLADWIDIEARARAGEVDEILGYHLEQAYTSLLELGPLTPRTEAVGRRAAAALASAGTRAFARGDMPAAVNLLSRAARVLPAHGSERLEILPQLAFALLETGDFGRLEEVVAEITETAAASGDSGLEAHAVILDLSFRLWTNPEGWAAKAHTEAPRAIAAFEEVGDERGLARGWSLLGLVHLSRAQFGGAEQAWREAATHAHRAGDVRDELECLSWVPLTVWAGPTTADDGMRSCREVLDRVGGDKKATSSALMALALFEAGLGHFDEARVLVAQARALLQEVALTLWLAGPLAQFAGWVELLAGEPAAAEAELRWGYETLTEIGELGWLSTVVAILSEAVYAQGRYEEAEQLTRTSEESADAEDLYSQALWRSVRAKILARYGREDDAERVAREAVDLADATDFPHLRWHTRVSQAEVLHLVGRAGEAGASAAEAALVAEQKGNVVGAGRARVLRDQLQELSP
jgi:class 3 adenylate cyclase/tetratricopeptide (TPR) repeat protein